MNYYVCSVFFDVKGAMGQAAPQGRQIIFGSNASVK